MLDRLCRSRPTGMELCCGRWRRRGSRCRSRPSQTIRWCCMSRSFVIYAVCCLCQLPTRTISTLPIGCQSTSSGWQTYRVTNAGGGKTGGWRRRHQRRDTLVRWADGARKRGRRASLRHHKRWRHLKDRGDELYRALNSHTSKLSMQGVSAELCRIQSKAMQRLADAELRELRYKMERALSESNAEHRKLERYCREQRTVLRALSDLNAHEQQMYELNNDKDQVMTVCKVALANLGMWVRDQYFPANYAQATWKRLEPFFKLSGQIVWERDVVRVTFRPFNDRQLNRDLAALCERVGAATPQLPDGRRLLLTIGAAHRLSLDVFSQ